MSASIVQAHRLPAGADGIVRLGLIGAGIQASRTPAMHMAEAAAQGFACDYRLIDLEVLHKGPDALPDLRTPYWICSASALPPSGSVMGLSAWNGKAAMLGLAVASGQLNLANC